MYKKITVLLLQEQIIQLILVEWMVMKLIINQIMYLSGMRNISDQQPICGTSYQITGNYKQRRVPLREAWEPQKSCGA